MSTTAEKATDTETSVPEHWPRVRLRDICEIVRGVSYKKDQASEQPAKGKVPILRATNIQNGALVLDNDLVFVPASVVSDEQMLRVGDIVVATSSGSKHLVGKTAQVKESWAGSFGAFCAALRPQVEIDHRYLGYFFGSKEYKDYITKKALGVNINNLRRGDLEDISVPVAPLDQQKRIVAEIEKQFSRLDEAIANLKRVKANLKRYTAAVLKAAIEGRLVPRVDVAGIPARWALQPIRDAITSLDQGWSPQCESEPADSDDNWAVMKTTAVQPLQYVDAENKKLPENLKPRPNLELKAGDLLITRAGPRSRVGVACLVKSTRRRIMLCDKVYRLRCKQEVATPAFLELVLNAPGVVDVLDELKTGISDSGVNLTQKRFQELLVPIPSIDEQVSTLAEVDRRFSLIREIEIQAEVNLTRAERLRQSILSRAFSGDLCGGVSSHFKVAQG